MAVVLLIINSSCRKFVEIAPPVDQLSTTTVFDTDSAAMQAVNGIYSEMMNLSPNFATARLLIMLAFVQMS